MTVSVTAHPRSVCRSGGLRNCVTCRAGRCWGRLNAPLLFWGDFVKESEWMSDWVNTEWERMNARNFSCGDWMNKWVSGWMSEWVSESKGVVICHAFICLPLPTKLAQTVNHAHLYLTDCPFICKASKAKRYLKSSKSWGTMNLDNESREKIYREPKCASNNKITKITTCPAYVQEWVVSLSGRMGVKEGWKRDEDAGRDRDAAQGYCHLLI